MPSEPTSPNSFSAGRRWGIFFSVLVSMVAVVALVVGLNYVSALYHTRFAWNSQMQIKLSPQTIFLLKSITNKVNVVIYYDKEDQLYGFVSAWLDEFHQVNPKISVKTVDYPREPAQAQQVKATYKQLGTAEDKNLVIFDCEGRKKIIQGALLGDYSYQQAANGKEREFTTHLNAFQGEKQFSSALLSVINSKVRRVYFLEGHNEGGLDSTGEGGFQKFGKVLEENNVTNLTLKLIGTNNIPADCNLLVIAGPTRPIPADELSKIRQYLEQGGRLFVLFNFFTRHTSTGLEGILAEWNLNVGMNLVSDPDNTQTGGAMVVANWKNHPLTSPLLASRSTLNMVLPREISALNPSKQGPETPRVEELAFTGLNALIGDTPKPAGRQVSLMAVVEKAGVKGVFPERGTTAILAVGDSVFLSNTGIDAADNRDFAGYAINWLLDQTQMLKEVGPHPVKEYKLVMTRSQINTVSWIFLAAMPGAILAFGGLVWFRRRH